MAFILSLVALIVLSPFKLRTISNAKDKEGNLLPDEMRLSKYGKFLRSTSLNKLPELWNIYKGDLSVAGDGYNSDNQEKLLFSRVVTA